MIYQQTSITINSDIEEAWNLLKKAMTTSDLPSIFTDCSAIEILSDNDGQIKRILKFSTRTDEEIVTVNFSNYRINSISNNNPTYLGEISYSLIKPNEAFLSEKNCTLVIISAWRMHPGVFAAPSLDKSAFINSIANNLKNEIESQSGLSQRL